MQKYSKNAFVNLRYVTANNHNVFKMADNDRAKNKEIIVLTKASDILIGVLLYQHEGLKVIPISNRDNNYAFVNKRIEENKHGYQRQAKEFYLLAGKVICKECGKYMSYQISKNLRDQIH